MRNGFAAGRARLDSKIGNGDQHSAGATDAVRHPFRSAPLSESRGDGLSHAFDQRGFQHRAVGHGEMIWR